MEPSAGLRPDAPARGVVSVPTSKSIAQRVLVASGLLGEAVRVQDLPDGEDVQNLLQALQQAGVDVRPEGQAVEVRGRAPGLGTGWHTGARGLDVGESGTAARLVTACAALCGRVGEPIRVTGSGSLARRSSPALFRTLHEAGCGLTYEGQNHGWPVRIQPLGPPSTLKLVEPGSSQEVTALLLALSSWPDTQVVEIEGPVPSRPYVDLTLGVLESFGVRVEDHGSSMEVPGPLRAPDGPLRVEPDASAAAVALAAGALSGGRVEVGGLGPLSRQGDLRIVEYLQSFGVRSDFGSGGPWAEGRPLRGASLDLTGEPDLTPVLAAVAGAVALEGGGESLLTGLETLPGKESSRIEVLAGGLRELGLRVEDTDHSLRILPGHPTSGPITLDPHGDHRMAFCFALLGLVRDGLDVTDPTVVGKSWPGFWEDLAAVGVRVERSG